MKVLTPSFDLDLARFGIKTGMNRLRSQQIKDHMTPPMISAIEEYEAPRPLTPLELSLAHSNDYIRRLTLNPAAELQRAYGVQKGVLNNESELYHSILKAGSTVIDGALKILNRNKRYDEGFLLQCYAGAHHARKHFGSGFCLINDIAVATKILLKNNDAKKILIVDLDAHMGDGNAEILNNEQRAFTLSIHGDAWPLRSELPIVPSNIDVVISPSNHTRYLELLSEALEKVKNQPFDFDFAFVLAGADAWEGDQLKSSSSVLLSEPDMLRRDMLVLEFLRANSIPNLWVMAGGYGDESFRMNLNFLNATI